MGFTFNIGLISKEAADIEMQYLVVKVLCLRNYTARSNQLLFTGKSLRSECSGRTHSSHSQLIGLMRAIMAIMAIRSQGAPGVTFGNILPILSPESPATAGKGETSPKTPTMC